MEGVACYLTAFAAWSLCLLGRWRKRERQRVRRLCMRFIRDGFIKLRVPFGSVFQTGYSNQKENFRARKRKTWLDTVKPTLEAQWRTKGLDIDDLSTWPNPTNGRAKDYTITSMFPRPNCLPKLCSDNYEVQAIICALYDDKLSGLFHFGEFHTHWKLKLLLRPVWFLMGSRMAPTLYTDMGNTRKTDCPRMVTGALFGSDEAWHIPLFPNKSNVPAGTVTPNGPHIDSGPHGIFNTLTIPFGVCNRRRNSFASERGRRSASEENRSSQISQQSKAETANANTYNASANVGNSKPSGSYNPTLSGRQRSFNDAMMEFAALQTAIIFYCDTPGILRKEQGSTGKGSTGYNLLLYIHPCP